MTIDPHRVGDIAEITVKGQLYQRVGEEPYTRKIDGKPAVLITWRSHCVDCGAEFDWHCGAEARTFKPPRTCPAHRKKLKWADRVQATDPATVQPATWPQRPFADVSAYEGER